jgi:Rps23 Pro-64 3,4-dihydroxylase Tpa1-like proline 4-hydroxylase
MTPKQILDSFSETLVRDERILSAQERALLATLLQHAKTATGENQEMQEAVRAVIASAVGETVAQRAFAVLGGSIVERILEGSPLPLGDSLGERTGDIFAREPQPPSRGPSPGPAVKAPLKAPQPPSAPLGSPAEPQPPSPQPPGSPTGSPGEPQPPSQGPGGSGVRTTAVAKTSAAERPAVLPAQCVVLDEFLVPQELEELIRFTLEREAAFSVSEVVSPSADGGIVNYEHRRSRVLMDLDHHQNVIVARIKAVLPQVLGALGMTEFAISDVEAQITASNHGDFFHFHSDNGSDRLASRRLTFVYFFHREPRQFEGGELRIHDAGLKDGTYVSQGSYQRIAPQQNQMVFFPCELLHEITSVNCASRRFADSRFTLNGWLHR